MTGDDAGEVDPPPTNPVNDFQFGKRITEQFFKQNVMISTTVTNDEGWKNTIPKK